MRRMFVLLFFAAFLMPAVVHAADRLTIGVQTGLGIEQEMFGSGPSSDVHLFLGELQVSAGLVMAGEHPRLQLVNSIVLGETIRPDSRFLLGLNETLRLHLEPGKKVGWYMEIGAGISSSALTVQETNGWLQYILEAGAGLRFSVGDSGSFIAGYRLTHLSNNHTARPNPGLNLHTVVLGYAFTLR